MEYEEYEDVLYITEYCYKILNQKRNWFEVLYLSNIFLKLVVYSTYKSFNYYIYKIFSKHFFKYKIPISFKYIPFILRIYKFLTFFLHFIWSSITNYHSY